MEDTTNIRQGIPTTEGLMASSTVTYSLTNQNHKSMKYGMVEKYTKAIPLELRLNRYSLVANIMTNGLDNQCTNITKRIQIMDMAESADQPGMWPKLINLFGSIT